MNKLLLLASLLLVKGIPSFEQTVSKSNKTSVKTAPGQHPVKADSTRSAPPAAQQNINPINALGNFADTPDTAIENRLVALTLVGPEYNAAIHQNKITEYELKKTKSTWLNLLTLSTNYNDQSLVKSTNTTLVYPKYFFGITIPLGIIFSTGTQVKQAREAVSLSRDQQEQLARKLKADVLGKYRQYQMYTILLTMQNEMLNDVLANASQAEQSFKDGTITVEVYIASQKTRNDEVSKNLNLKLQQEMMRLDIERMIGVPLDEVLHPQPPSPPPAKTGH